MAGPVLVTPGQTVSTDDWNALLLQHGNIQSSTALPIDDPSVVALLGKPGMAATLHQHPIYRYYMQDGTYVDSYTDENGQDSHIVDYKPSARFTAQHPAAGTAAGGTNTSIAENPVSHKPSQMTTYPDGRPPTYDDTQVPAAVANQGLVTTTTGTQLPDGNWDNTRPREVVKRPDGTVVSDKPLEGPALTAWQEDQERTQNEAAGKGRLTNAQVRTAAADARQQKIDDQSAATAAAASRRADSAEARAVAEANRVGSTVKDLTINGQHYTTITKTSPDGKTTTVENYGPDGNLLTTPLPQEGTGTFSSEIGTFTPDITKPQMGLQERAKQLAELRSLGKITDAQYEAAKKDAYDAAVAEAKRVDAINSAQQAAAQSQVQQRGQDIQGSTSRLGAANQASSTALEYANKMSGAMTPSSMAAAGGPILPAIMAMQDARAQSWGGLNQPPQVNMGQFPAWSQLAHMGISGAAPIAPAIQQAGAAGAPNAIGLGAVGAQPAPGAATPAAYAGTPGAAPAVGLPTPIFRPQPPAAYPGAGGPTSGLGQGQDLSTPPVSMASPYAGQTLPGIAAMDPRIGALLQSGGDDPDWRQAVMMAAQNHGLV